MSYIVTTGGRTHFYGTKDAAMDGAVSRARSGFTVEVYEKVAVVTPGDPVVTEFGTKTPTPPLEV